MGVDTRGPVDQWGGRTLSSGVWVGPARAAGTPNPGSASQQVLAAHPTYVDRQTGQTRNTSFADAVNFVRDSPRVAGAQTPAFRPPPRQSGGSGSSSRGRGGGGGRGRGGGGGANVHAQSQMDYLTSLLASGAYKVNPATYDTMRTSIGDATTKDQQAATGAYNNLDTYLQGHQTNPYADVHLQAAQRAPDMNPYLATQGVAGTNYQASNPEDQGYGAFQNILSLLGANQLAGNQSQLSESQMGRTYAGQQIGAMDNAYLANVGNQQAAAQTALDTERRQAAMQLAQLIAQGAKPPNLAALGLG